MVEIYWYVLDEIKIGEGILPSLTMLPLLLCAVSCHRFSAAADSNVFREFIPQSFHHCRAQLFYPASLPQRGRHKEFPPFLAANAEPVCLSTIQAQHFVTDLTAGAYFDEDAQGFRRIVAHGDDWMHSRLFHEGVEQRIRVEVRARYWLWVRLAEYLNTKGYT